MQLEKGPTLAYVPTCILAHVTCYNKVVSKSLLVFLSGVLLLGIGFYLYTTDRISFVSPIPKIFGVSNTDEIHNYWFPRDIGHDYSDLNLSARSAILVDYDTGEIIFAKNIHARQPVASTVKIMTALLALKNKNMNDVFTISQHAAKVGENSMILGPGEKLTLEQLLYGMMLVSGNDAATAIGENVAGNEDKFVEMMNSAVQQMGLTDTKYVNPSGLDDDNKTQYSTPYDMAVIAHYLWENYPQIRGITSTYHKFIDATSDHKDYELYNDTNLLTSYPGVKGIKPGVTWESGLCLVTYAENDGKKLLGVILGSDDRRGEMKELLDFGFGSFGIKVDHPALDL